MARTTERRATRRSAGTDEPVQIDEKKYEKAKRDPRKRAFADASKEYVRRVRSSGAGD